eukprot:24678_1
MAKNVLSVLVLFICTVVLTQEEYPFANWMHQLSSQIATKTIFEIVMPGAHKAGMSWSTSTTNIDSPYANDHFSSRVQTLGELDKQRAWAERQRLSIYQLLMRGIRVLDLQFEHDGLSPDSGYYTHNGLYGQSVDQILDGIALYMSESYIENEIIILYVSDFTTQPGVSEEDSSSSLATLFNIMTTHSIHTHIIKPNTYDITTQTISELTANQVNIILFTDEFPSTTDAYNEWFYDSNQYLNIAVDMDHYFKDNITETLSETQALIVNNLRTGWDPHTLNLIYWMPIISTAFVEKYFYDSYFAFNAPFSAHLHSFTVEYPKLWYANVLLSDFIGSSDVVQQSIALNIQYAQCNDDYLSWSECRESVDLSNTFSTHDAPLSASQCQSTTSCKRSCGLCPNERTNPGDSCVDNGDCSGEIYSIFTTSETGICATPTGAVHDGSPFCLSVFPKDSCIDYWSVDWTPCGHTNLSQCTTNCSADYDCVDGFCNSQYSVCMSWNTTETWRSFADSLLYEVQRYWRIVSDDAASVLARLEAFRPGDSSASYTETSGTSSCSTDTEGEVMGCVFESVAVSPYMTSVIGLMFIPLILSMLLCVCYCCIWPWWCCCEDYTKKCCCAKCCDKCYDEETTRCCCENDPLKCIGTPENSPWIHWIPCVVLGIAVVVSLWACIDGLVANTNIHEVIFDEPESFQVQTDNFIAEIVDRLTEVQPSLEFIVSSGVFMLETTFSIIVKTKDVESHVNDFNEALHVLTTDYVDALDLTATVINPFDSIGNDTYTFTIQCAACHDLTDSALEIGNEFDTIIVRTLEVLVNTIKQFEPLIELRETIKEHAEVLFTDLDGVVQTIEGVQTDVSNAFVTASELDSKYRETWVTIFLCFTLILVVLPCIGMIIRHKCCFKVNWCCGMWLGTLMMFITSFAALIIVLWGDFCVRLDDFEEYGADSQMAKNLGLEENAMELVNACFTGQSITELYGLDDVFNWDALRVSVRTQLTSRTQDAMYLDQLVVFKAELDALNTNAFTEYVERLVLRANEVGGYCGCGEAGVQFSKENLLDPVDECTSEFAAYWEETNSVDGGVCQNAFVNASFAVQSNASLFSQTESTMDEFKENAFNVFHEYDSVIYPLSLELYNELHELSCVTDPLFDAIDQVVFNFSNCGFVGEYYGSVKENGCVLLFNETYYIARALTVIAFMCIIIVFFSYCMDYVYGPPVKFREKKKEYDYVSDDNVDIGDTNGNIQMAGQANTTNESDGLLHSAGDQPQTVFQADV